MLFSRILELDKGCAELRAEVARLREEARWIPTAERMPKVGEDVLIKLPDWVWIGHRTSDGWYSYGQWGKVAVTHWRALPLPPEVTP